jgi:hypothetical protein
MIESCRRGARSVNKIRRISPKGHQDRPAIILANAHRDRRAGKGDGECDFFITGGLDPRESSAGQAE